ncbi:MAG TPA: beta-ketoacyl-[acyl-carrier-protein] synthase family protein [Pyrinomonadaceae bacterium]|nr:beta-ketoacyl-[acyl-carrier-protein] synthase family protein [Chloracidobacterium sp.]MBP9934211.1 beta-ketoacyl-[acyl-carrier-protein] synthase family protein [Pyrinomonadaceae bacterium]MBK7801592.1 beta-ketoacyl-[acyl-carrier-protein] synthase family protein [Chloracidobacterium sp.]MBK9766565.1 beta-ketoacyl-[acyl-carrier-protein] synthase family protein [Chloracidobacterium sp.]MBL0241902.1 beta-ketoacyl-[acyl-carrier-protein] synthase family protein [Chloracidobacterium sp.]
MKRVVITGLGVVSPIGNDAASFWNSLTECRSAIGPMTKVDGSTLRFQNVAEVSDFIAADHFDEKSLLWLDPFTQYGIVAAREAIVDSGLELTDELRDRGGVVTGSCLGGKMTEDELFYKLYAEGKQRHQPIAIPRAMSNAAASHISMEFGLTGPTFTISTACSSANHAIGQAFWLIRQGTIDMAVAGGSEAPICYGNLKAWESMRVVSQDTCRPFSRDRSGMILGEGAAMFVMETLESAQKRGARIYAEIAGFGMSADAHHLTMPLSSGAAKAMRAALSDGGIAPEQVGYINAHGTATQANDPMEAEAIRSVFGQHTDALAVSSTKSMHGHALGAAGAIESAATILAIHNKVLPPTANFNEADPDCPLDVIPNEARPATVEAAISNSFAFGGLNAVVAFRRWNG